MNQLTTLDFDQEDAFWETAKDDVVLTIREVLKEYQSCRIGLAGGSTPRRLYQMLAKESLPWKDIVLISIDERYVPSDHPQSNLKMIRDTLTKHVQLPPEHLLHFDTSLPIDSAAKNMSRQLINLTHERFPLFDLLILGAGADGHIASLFEGDAALQSSYYASPAHAAGQEVEQRLTLTPMALRSAARALLLLKGPQKQPVHKALTQGTSQPPLTALREVNEKVPFKILSFIK